MIGNPSNLELLLHCYYSNEAHPNFDMPAIQAGIQELRNADMIKRSEKFKLVYDATPKAEAYIDYLMKVPYPEQHWIVPQSD